MKRNGVIFHNERPFSASFSPSRKKKKRELSVLLKSQLATPARTARACGARSRRL